MREIPLTKGKFSTIDDEDYEMLSVFSWCVNDGYAYNAKAGRMHRFLLRAPKGVQVDHVNGDRLDNRRGNLRLCTPSQNQANRGTSTGVSKFKGVTWQKRPSGAGAWKAQITVLGEVNYLGMFRTDLEAAEAYNRAALEHFGDFACVNDLDQLPSEQISTERRRQARRFNPSGFKGVTFDSARGKWMAQLVFNRVCYLKKRYATALDAARAYDQVVRVVHGAKAMTNF